MQEFEYIGLIIVFGLVYIIVIIAMAVTGFSIFRSRKLHRARVRLRHIRPATLKRWP